MPFDLRNYQLEAIRKTKEAIQEGTAILINLPTGGGKTVFAVQLIVDEILTGKISSEHPVLIISKGWPILQQFYKTLLSYKEIKPKDIGRLGGDGTVLGSLKKKSVHAKIILSTLSSFGAKSSRAAYSFRKLKPALVFWDECHWGDRAKMGNKLFRWAKRRSTPLIGLTATPKSEKCSCFDLPLYSISFQELIDAGFLAQPISHVINTEQDWKPRICTTSFDYLSSSLNELDALKRNQLIVETYYKKRSLFGKTVVFALNVQNADHLAEIFRRYNVPVGVLHSGYSEADNRATEASFRKNEIDVLVNVKMLTTGIDIPDIESIFMCRPTTSEILYTQMVGRGARKPSPDKSSFHVVDFTDNIIQHGDILSQSYRTFFSLNRSSSKTIKYNHRRVRHFFKPDRAPLRLRDEAIPKDCHSFWISQGQSFGVEFELTRWDYSSSNTWKNRHWTSVAEKIRKALVFQLGEDAVCKEPLSYGSGRYDVWNVEYDRTAGWEIKSPILYGLSGIKELVVVCGILQSVAEELVLKVNHKTGLHIHLGWNSDLQEAKDLMHLMRLLEPGLASLVAPSRVVGYSPRHSYNLNRPNMYCKPICVVSNGGSIERKRKLSTLSCLLERYVTLNLSCLESKGTVEFRMHSGSLDASKIILWLSLCQQILYAAKNLPLALPSDFRNWVSVRRLAPSGDIVTLSEMFLPDGKNIFFSQRLHQRRLEILERWRSESVLLRWNRFALDWKSPHSNQ